MDFDKCVEVVKNLKKKPNDDELLELYALYKQALFGDNTTVKPGLIDFKGCAKWNAWTKKKGCCKF
ncbi:unnamed protein product [Dracunculus medinensis]|uniref:ACB domain-containing protein n=1 Tax=Dracunculus medinensis TaxID=318479 RepID=A0A0N4UID6_DRAME|nr:unnamed protein product [Dracunculus medinensis]